MKGIHPQSHGSTNCQNNPTNSFLTSISLGMSETRGHSSDRSGRDLLAAPPKVQASRCESFRPTRPWHLGWQLDDAAVFAKRRATVKKALVGSRRPEALNDEAKSRMVKPPSLVQYLVVAALSSSHARLLRALGVVPIDLGRPWLQWHSVSWGLAGKLAPTEALQCHLTGCFIRHSTAQWILLLRILL